MSELTLQEAALAWAQGKRVEAIGPSGIWGLIQQPGGTEGYWQPYVFNGYNCGAFRFRLAPEPPAKRFRPWTPEEVPVGAMVTNRDWTGKTYGRFMITGVNSEKALWTCASQFGDATFKWLLEERFSHSTDGGKTWAPCGVEVKS